MENSEYSEKLKDPEKNQGPDVVDGLEMAVNDVAMEYINNLDDPAEIKENNGLFVDMIKYIYRHYLGGVIGNNKNNSYGFRYDYYLLDKLFYIYTSLVYKYKANKRPSILEFTLFINMDRNTIYNAAMGHTKKLTNNEISMVKKWYTECENQLTNGGSVFEIFLLKSQYRYNDNLAPIPIENQGPALTADQLPDFSSCHNATLEDKSSDGKT